MAWANATTRRHLRPGTVMRRVQLALLYIFRKCPSVQIMLHAPTAVGKSFICLCWSAQLGPRPGKVLIVLEPTVELAKNQVTVRGVLHKEWTRVCVRKMRVRRLRRQSLLTRSMLCPMGVLQVHEVEKNCPDLTAVALNADADSAQFDAAERGRYSLGILTAHCQLLSAMECRVRWSEF